MATPRRNLSTKQGIEAAEKELTQRDMADAAVKRLAEEKARREEAIKNSDLGVKMSEIRSNRHELQGYEEKSQQSLYQMLAKIVGFVRLSKTTEGQRTFNLICSEMGIDPRNNTDLARNEYLPHFRVLFQTSAKDRLSPQLYKWAQAVRALIDENLDEPEVVEFITTFSYNNKTKLAGLISYDSNNHKTNRGNQSGVSDKIYKLRRRVEDYEIGSIRPSTQPKTAEKMCLVLGETKASGEVVLRAFYDGEDLDRMIAKFLPKAGKDAFITAMGKAVDEDLEEEETQEDDV